LIQKYLFEKNIIDLLLFYFAFFCPLNRIPKIVMHEFPTTLLHSLEGMPNLNWERLLKLQSNDGSFLFSPSATAYAVIQTNDEKCLGYLQQIVNKFHGGGKRY
jgi:ent-copalyl diphosphate synthase